MEGFAGFMANRAARWLKNHPNQAQKLGQKALNIASTPAFQQKAMQFGQQGLQMARQPGFLNQVKSIAGIGASGSLEQRVSRIEQMLGLQGGKQTRKQKRKQRKTRKH